MDGWERFKTIATAISVIAIPVVVAWLGNNYTSAIKEREIQGRFVELAVNILKETPDESKKNIRSWAAEIINKYSGVPLNEETQKDLIKSIPLVRDVPPSKDEVKKVVGKYREEVEAALAKPIGQLTVELDGANARTRETNFGNLVADLMREASGADMAIINGGSIRSSIKAGPVTTYDLYRALPFENYLVVVKVPGKQIRAALENGVSATEREDGRFPQVSGVRFSYSPSALAGERIKDATIGGKPLDPDRIYSVATNEFLAAGGDGYRLGPDGASPPAPVDDRPIHDLVIDYLKGKKSVSPKVDGRIRVVK